MAAAPVIEVEGLTVTYDDFVAVRDLSFEVRPGELYALLGTNGAGKTSTLEVVEGHRRSASGTVRIFGGSPLDRRAVRPRMGIMLQESGFSPDLTVRESVGLIGALSGREDDVDRLLGVAGLTRKADTQVALLSGGEKRRLDFATAVFGGPDLVILDEPTTGLDIQSRDALWDRGGPASRGRGHGRPHDPLPRGGPAAGRPHRAHARGIAAQGGHGCRADRDPAGSHQLQAPSRRTRATDRRDAQRRLPRRDVPPAGRPAPTARLGPRERVSSWTASRPVRPASTTSSAPSTT